MKLLTIVLVFALSSFALAGTPAPQPSKSQQMFATLTCLLSTNSNDLYVQQIRFDIYQDLQSPDSNVFIQYDFPQFKDGIKYMTSFQAVGPNSYAATLNEELNLSAVLEIKPGNEPSSKPSYELTLQDIQSKRSTKLTGNCTTVLPNGF